MTAVVESTLTPREMGHILTKVTNRPEGLKLPISEIFGNPTELHVMKVTNADISVTRKFGEFAIELFDEKWGGYTKLHLAAKWTAEQFVQGVWFSKEMQGLQEASPRGKLTYGNVAVPHFNRTLSSGEICHIIKTAIEELDGLSIPVGKIGSVNLSRSTHFLLEAGSVAEVSLDERQFCTLHCHGDVDFRPANMAMNGKLLNWILELKQKQTLGKPCENLKGVSFDKLRQ